MPPLPLLGRRAVASRSVSVARWAAMTAWLLVGVSASYWVLRGWGNGPEVVVPTLRETPAADDVHAVARALGAGGPVAVAGDVAQPAEVGSRHALQGVARRSRAQGVALIATDGQPAKPYRVGMALPDGWVLRELTPREALLTPPEGPGEMRLTLPSKP